MKVGGRDWSDAFIMQEIPRIAVNYQKLGERHVMDSFPGSLERALPCQYFDF